MKAARLAWSNGQTGIDTPSVDGRRIAVFHDIIRPPARLLLLGAGADALPLARCADMLGWRVSVADYRQSHVRQGRFPRAGCHLLTPQQIGDWPELERFDAVVLMTHNFDYDRRYLQRLAASPIPFIGLLGPAQRRDKLLQSLGAAKNTVRRRIFGPIGLDIGARSPEEIAVSVMAGIEAALNRRSGGQLDAIRRIDEPYDACLPG